MKLLLDQNLSPRLCDGLADLGTSVVHVRTVGLEASDDEAHVGAVRAAGDAYAANFA